MSARTARSPAGGPSGGAGLRHLALVAGLLSLHADVTAAAIQSAAQRHCITALNRAGAKLSGAAAGNALSCLKDAAAERLPSGQTCEQCLTADRDGLIARTESYVTTRAARSCTVPPDFGPTTAGGVNAAFSSPNGLHEIFGPDLDAALIDERTDAAGAACQQAVARAMAQIATAKLKAFNSCKVHGLKRRAITSANALRSCFEADPGGRVTVAIARAPAPAGPRRPPQSHRPHLRPAGGARWGPPPPSPRPAPRGSYAACASRSPPRTPPARAPTPSSTGSRPPTAAPRR